MEVLVEKHLADIPSDVRSDAVFSMLETLLTHIVNGDQDYVDGDEQLQLLRAQACVILMSCIRRNAQSASVSPLSCPSLSKEIVKVIYL